MVQLLSCSRGHFWEAAEEDNGTTARPALCPVCGTSAESMPLLALAEEPLVAEDRRDKPGGSLPLRDAAGRPVVAGYDNLEDLGRGPTGMLHFKAKQQLVNRPVLLRVVFARDDPGQHAWGSLRGEASALGKLPHPNVLQIHEAGERDRQLFYNVLEWLDGPTLADKLAEGPLPPRQIALLVEMLARALHFAHERGVVHRCLQPASVLLQKPSGVAPPPFCQLGDDFYLPRLTDFGLHRRPVEGDVNDVHLQRGLPFYLSPEQAWGRAKEIGPSCDIHALGAILFQLLTGEPPFKGDTGTEIVEKIQTREAPKLGSVAQGKYRALVRAAGDLELICRKCLRKEPHRRYATALELAEDLRRYLTGRSVMAGVGGRTNAERFSRWLRRRAGATFLVLFVLGGGLGLLALVPNKDLNGLPPQVHQAAMIRDNLQHIAQLHQSLDQAHQQVVVADYARLLAVAQRDGNAEALNSVPHDLRLWEFHYLSSELRKQPTRVRLGSCAYPIQALAFSPTSRLVAAGAGTEARDRDAIDSGGKGEVKVWNVQTRREQVHLRDFGGPVRGVAFSPDGNVLATASFRLALNGGIGEVAAWTVTDRFRRIDPWGVQQFFQKQICSVAYPPDGQYVLSLDREGTLRYHLAQDGIVDSTTPNPAGAAWRHAYSRDLPLAALSRKGSWIAAVVGPDSEGLFLCVLGSQPRRLAGHTDLITGLTADPDSLRFASCSRDGTVRLWASFGEELHVLKGHRGSVSAVAFSPDGKRLASCGQDNTIRLWDPDTGMELFSLPSPAKDPHALAFGPDGLQLAVSHGSEVTLLGGQP